MTMVEEGLKKSYDLGLNSLEKEMQFDINFVRDPDSFNFLVDYTFDNIRDMQEDMAGKLRQVLQRGLMNGKSTQQLQKDVQNVLDVSYKRAEVIARTESVRAFNTARFDAAKQLPLKTKKWLLWTNDKRTSEVTKAAHVKYGSPEKAIPMDEPFKVEVNGKVWESMTLPLHPNERD